jgi:tetratricopeptide (TPR) repeat protein
VEGEIFHRGAVEALAGGEPDVPARLAALVRKELVRPERAQLRGDDAYRFRHLLIRDAAYEALPKAVRAELHERFADWLEKRGGDLVELDEILGYHLERAHRYRVELGPPDAGAAELAGRASDRLAAAGRRAYERGDLSAETGLLRRAVALAGETPGSVSLRLELARALYRSGEVEAAADAAEAARALARGAGERGAELLALKELAEQRLWAGTAAESVELMAIAAEAIPFFEARGDDAGLTEAWWAIADAEWLRCQCAESVAALTRAIEHARRAGKAHIERTLLHLIGQALVHGPTPTPETLSWHEEHRWLETTRPSGGVSRGQVLGMLGRFEEGRQAILEAEGRMREMGVVVPLGGAAAEGHGQLELLAGNAVEAERQSRVGCDLVERSGQFGVLATYSGYLARVLLELGCDDEAEHWSRRSEELGARDDGLTQMLFRQARARVLARRGEHDAAIPLAREAVQIGERTDMLFARGNALADLAEVLELAGDTAGAGAALERALAEYERKGVPPAVEQARARLAALGRVY